MTALELVCLLIVAQFVVIRARRDPRPWAFVRRLGALAVAAWIGEDTCIRLYGFYEYAPSWTLWVDVTPLAVPLIWPVVVHSAWDLARYLLPPGSRWVVPAAAAIVLADASFIEPIAVRAGLWWWTKPGLFAVPPVGVLGWALFALAALTMLTRWPRLLERPLGWLALWVGAPLACHALLLAAWWGALRWVSGPVPAWPAVAVAAAGSAWLTWRALRGHVRRRIPRAEMLARVPAATFFMVLLVAYGLEQPALVAWSLAFSPPYLACVDFAGRSG